MERRNEWISMSEAARRLGTNRSGVWRLVKAGRLEARENPQSRLDLFIRASSVADEFHRDALRWSWTPTHNPNIRITARAEGRMMVISEFPDWSSRSTLRQTEVPASIWWREVKEDAEQRFGKSYWDLHVLQEKIVREVVGLRHLAQQPPDADHSATRTFKTFVQRISGGRNRPQ